MFHAEHSLDFDRLWGAPHGGAAFFGMYKRKYS